MNSSSSNLYDRHVEDSEIENFMGDLPTAEIKHTVWSGDVYEPSDVRNLLFWFSIVLVYHYTSTAFKSEYWYIKPLHL